MLALAETRLAERLLVQAIELFYQAEEAGADRCICAGGRWQAMMLMGNFEAAWRESDMLQVLNPDDDHRLWRGESVAGKRLIIRCLHGLGDAIQFLRYAPQLSRITAQLIVQVPPTLVPLARCIAGVRKVITWDELSVTPLSPWDVQLEVMQLPYVFRTTLSSIPSTLPYLQLPASELSHAAKAMKDSAWLPRIGLCSSCGKWNESRAIPMQRIMDILSQAPAHYYNLQQEPLQLPIGLLPPEASWNESCELGPGPLRLAAVIANLDLIITVDTLVAHIAGAMGKPVWLMLQYAADWRWMHDRGDSSWYPTMRIFRQPRPGDWTSVLELVVSALKTFSTQASHTCKGSYAQMG